MEEENKDEVLPLASESIRSKSAYFLTSSIETLGDITRSASKSFGNSVTNIRQSITQAMRRDELQLYQQYCILEGLSLFAMADQFKNAPSTMMKASQNKFVFTFEKNGNVKMTMKHIKVEEFEEWGEIKADYFNELSNSFCEINPGTESLEIKKHQKQEEEGFFSSGLTKLKSMTFGQSDEQNEIDKIPLVAKITWHQMDQFKKVVAPNDLINSLHQSMSPSHNRGSTFKNDVGGRSGSIFFFSHDKKFLVKTMTDRELEYMLTLLPKFSNHLLSKK